MKAAVNKKDAAVSSPESGLLRYVMASSHQMTLVRHEMKAGWKGARHSHPQEQLVYVIRGRLRFSCGAELFDIAAGDSLIVPANVEHEAAALDDAEVLDVFSPFRADYLPKESYV